MRSIAMLAVLTLIIGVSPLMAQQWQTNQPGSTLTIDGITGTGTMAATTTIAPGATTFVAASSTNTGLGWEIAIGLQPIVPIGGGAIVTAGGQALNIDVTDPALAFLNGGTLPAFAPFPGNFSFPISVSVPVTISAQQIVVDLTLSDGIAISQPATLQVVNGMPMPGPTSDDGTATISLGGMLGGPSSIPFYATTYTEITVMSNGRVMPGPQGDGDFSPTQAEAVADNAFVGFWTDLNPGLGGTITVSAPTSTQVRIDYQNINYFGEGSVSSNFAIVFDSVTGEVIIDGVNGIVANPLIGSSFATGDSQFLGISGGNGLASDGGPTTFAFGGTGSGTMPTDMIYDWYDQTTGTGGLVNSLVPGTLNQIRFIPGSTGVPSYFWAGF